MVNHQVITARDARFDGRLFVGVNWEPPAVLDAANAARALGVIPANQQVPYDVQPATARAVRA